MKKGETGKSAKEIRDDQHEDVLQKLWHLNGLFTALSAMGRDEVLYPDAIDAITDMGRIHVNDIRGTLNKMHGYQ